MSVWDTIKGIGEDGAEFVYNAGKAVVNAVTNPDETIEDAYEYGKKGLGWVLGQRCVPLKLNKYFWIAVLQCKVAYKSGLIKSKGDLIEYAVASGLATANPLIAAGAALWADCVWEEVVKGSTENAVVNATAVGVVQSELTGRVIAQYVTAVSRSRDKLDIFSVAAGGQVRTAAWQPEFTDWWHGWWHLAKGVAEPGAYIGTVSRSKDKLDVFLAGNDHRVWTAAWEQGRDTTWRGWWPIGDLKVPPGSPVTAVSRSADKLDIFAVDDGGNVCTAAWQPEFTDWWHGWWHLAGGTVVPGAYIGAVSRSKDKLDVFLAGNDHRVWTAAWEQGRDTTWRGWWAIGDLKVPPGSPVTAVSRSADKLDIFAVDDGGNVCTAAWQPEFTDGWHGWWNLAGGKAAPGAYVGAVSRSKDKLDVFVVGNDNRVWTAAWEQGRDTTWRGWWPIGDLKVAPGSPVAAVSRSADKLDIFVLGPNRKVYTAAWEQGRDTAWRGWWSIEIYEVG